MELNTDTEAGQIATLTREALKLPATTVEGPGGRTYLVTPSDMVVKEITPMNAAEIAKPKNIAQAVVIQTAESMGEYLSAYKTTSSLLFANIDANRIVGALDYHSPSAPELVTHTATLNLPFSSEWKIWTGIDGKMMSQLDFARFLDENTPDIASPHGADLVEVVRDLITVKSQNAAASVDINKDNVDFRFEATTDARSGRGGQLEIPKTFMLDIPVYFGEPSIQIEARLRWGESEGGVKFGVALLRKDNKRQDEFHRVAKEVSEAAGLKLIYGALAA